MLCSVLSHSNCGAVAEDTWIQLVKGERKKVRNISEEDLLLTSHESQTKIRSLWKRMEEVFYKLEIPGGQTLKVTGQQCLLTKTGWKRARHLRIGDEIMYYDFRGGRAYYPIATVEKQKERESWAYAIGIGDKTFIANGFICSDYDMQHGRNTTQRRNENVCE